MARRMLIALVTVMSATLAAHGQTAGQAADSQTRTKNLTAYAELLRSDLRAQKVAIITEVMDFTEAESGAFWPIYRDYDAEMSKLGDERAILIDEYARNFDTLSDQTADALATKAIDLDTRRRAALAKCYDRVKKATSAKRALQFLQVEHQLQLIVDLQISASLPIAK